MTLKIAGLTQKSNLQVMKLLQQKWQAEQSASEADSSDQLSEIRLATKEWQIVFMIRNHICDPNKRMDFMVFGIIKPVSTF